MGEKKRPTRDELERRCARLERALRWYANPDHWSSDDWGVRSVIQSPDYGNPGSVAQRALRSRSKSRGRNDA